MAVIPDRRANLAVRDAPSNWSVDDVRARVADAFELGIDDAVRDIFQTVVEQVAAYRALMVDPATAAQVRGSIRALLHVFVDVVRAGRCVTPKEVALMAATGARRADQGLTAEDLQWAALVALKVGVRHVHTHMRALGPTPTSFDVNAVITEAMYDFVEEFARAAGTGIRTIHGRRAAERTDVVDQILDGAISEEAAIKDVMTTIGLPVGAPYTLLLLTPCRNDTHGALDGAASNLANGHIGLLRGPIRSTPIPHAVAIAASDYMDECAGRIGYVAEACHLLVLAERVSTLCEVAPIYSWACDLLRVGVAATRPAGVIGIEDLVDHWLTSGVPRGHDFLFVKCTLGPLLAADRSTSARVLRSLAAYFAAGGSIKKTSASLGVDARTIQRHLAEFETRTGRSPRDPRQSLRAQQALHLLELRGAAFPPPGDPGWSPA